MSVDGEVTLSLKLETILDGSSQCQEKARAALGLGPPNV